MTNDEFGARRILHSSFVIQEFVISLYPRSDPRRSPPGPLKSLPCSRLHASKFNGKTDLQRLGRRSSHLRGVDVAAPSADAADALPAGVAVGQRVCRAIQARLRRRAV